MDFAEFERENSFRRAWEAIDIVRSSQFGLFTFGDTELPYFLVCGDESPGALVTVTQGQVRIQRPVIITNSSGRPELEGFFDNADEEDAIQFLLARTAQFSNLRFDNRSIEKKTVSDSIEETVEKLAKRLDTEEEDRVGIITAPSELGGFAVLRYAAEKVLESGPDNIQELRERGFLP